MIERLHNNFETEINDINHIILSNITSSDADLIREIGNYLIKSGGKRIRPLLTILSAKLFFYEGVHHINLAASTEFIHAATLLHDDVVDSSLLRRFKPTANTLWGNQASILVGDFLFSQAFKLMVSSGSIEALRTLANASAIIATGEIYQLEKNKASEVFSRDDYFTIINAKTAELFGSACKVGAIISDASGEQQKCLYEYGKRLGQIFQIRDDLLDYSASLSNLGKNIGDDFYESKITLPIIILCEVAKQSDKDRIENIFLNKESKTEEDLELILKFLSQYKIENEINEVVTNITAEARNYLNMTTSKNTEIINAMNDLLEFAASRNK